MKQYQFSDVLYLNRRNAIQVENKEKEDIGTIEKSDISGCEKGSVVSFIAHNGSPIKIGIKKRNIKSLLVATYVIKTEEKTYFLKDKPGNSLLYFCVVGNIDGQDIRIEENWSSDIEVKIDQIHIATIKVNELTFKTTILIEDNIYESSILFAITILMYFMHKTYKNESEFIENILFD
ncbi:hypothetical protein [Oceanobacillus neutriphilus]|uniref:Uncharacterized protein n=1 Tax=Oceanobacillus neutriphilus TaxID=531815 RepID=A0ABQ2NRF0_9BACI|nr:hypothetical protein [Oceanobacillus neutriphilus]GGP08687.1 hypothetical protein GCM10011346_09720 [Oceanobacillus neutriphilus]